MTASARDESPARKPTGPPRVPPFRPVPDHDASLLRLLFRGARFPDTEWWSHSIHLIAEAEDGERRELSLFVNVQLLAEPFRGEVASAAVVAVRDVHSGERWILRSRGTMGSARSCRYSSPGWSIVRLDPDSATVDADAIGVGLDAGDVRHRFPGGAVAIQVAAEDVELGLILRQRKVAVAGQDGWVDYNPDGQVPLWTSAKVRIATPEGFLSLPDARRDVRRYEVVSGHAHSEQQCIVPSASIAPLVSGLLTPTRSLDTLLEAVLQRPRWHWFHTNLPGDVQITAHRVWNPRTGKPYRDQATLLGRSGFLSAGEFTCTAPRDDGRGAIPASVTLGFTVPTGEHGIAPGRYELVFEHRVDVDWTVPFVLPLGRICLANEAHCSVQVHHEGKPVSATVGGHETIDLLSSIVRDP